jgi:ATP synthase protein I
MTDPTPSSAPHAGAPFGAMLRGALLPSVLAGLLTVVVLVAVRGVDALAGALIGLVVSVAFFASGMFLLSKLVRSASPHAFVALAMAVYLGQVFVLLLVIIAFKDADWVDGVALGLVALVVTIAWQVFAMLALRRARTLVYDEPSESPGDGR